MNNSVIPPRATHTCEMYGRPEYYRRWSRWHLNQVSEEWRIVYDWCHWDRALQQWVPVESGFSDRSLVPLGDGLYQDPAPL